MELTLDRQMEFAQEARHDLIMEAKEVYREDYENYLECAKDEGITGEALMDFDEFVQECQEAEEAQHMIEQDYYRGLGV